MVPLGWLVATTAGQLFPMRDRAIVLDQDRDFPARTRALADQLAAAAASHLKFLVASRREGRLPTRTEQDLIDATAAYLGTT